MSNESKLDNQFDDNKRIHDGEQNIEYLSAKRPRHALSNSAPRQGGITILSATKSPLLSSALANWSTLHSNSKEKVMLGVEPYIYARIYNEVISKLAESGAMVYLIETGYMERLLWPTFAHKVKSGSNSQEGLHALVFSILGIVEYCQQHSLYHTSALLRQFDNNADALSNLVDFLFRCELSSLSVAERCVRLSFLTFMFRTLDYSSPRSVFLPLVSLPVWLNLSTSALQAQLDDYPELQKPLAKLSRRAKKRDLSTPIPLPECALMLLVDELHFELCLLVASSSEDAFSVSLHHMALFAVLLSQLRLRRIVLALLVDRSTFPFLLGVSLYLLSYSPSSLAQVLPDWNRLINLMAYYINFPISEDSGASLPYDTILRKQTSRLFSLQRAVFDVAQRPEYAHYSALKLFPMLTHSVIGNTDYLLPFLVKCGASVLNDLSEALNIREPLHSCKQLKNEPNNPLLNESALLKLNASTIAAYCCMKTDAIALFRNSPVYVTEKDMWNDRVGNSRSMLASPKLDTEFLDLKDFLFRNFTLLKWEASEVGRLDIEKSLQNSVPVWHNGFQILPSTCRSAAVVRAVRTFGSDIVTLDDSSFIRLEVELDAEVKSHTAFADMNSPEFIYLVKLHKSTLDGGPLNKNRARSNIGGLTSDVTVRCCLLDCQNFSENGKLGRQRRGRQKIYGLIEKNQCSVDNGGLSTTGNTYEGFNLVIRSSALASSYLYNLSALQSIILSSKHAVSGWIEEMLIGRSVTQYEEFGNYDRTSGNIFDLRDTFLTREQAEQCFSSKILIFDEDVSMPPSSETNRAMYKVKSFEEDGDTVEIKSYFETHKSYIFPWLGKYRTVELNNVRFSEKEGEAIFLSMHRGMILVDSPLQGRRLQCIVQLLFNLVHTNPKERILLVAHSTKTLNKYIEKLVRRVEDDSSVVRFGAECGSTAEEKLLTAGGRVDMLLRRRLELLGLVEKLGHFFEGVGRETSSWTCEAASALFENTIIPTWQEFLESSETSWDKFPLKGFFQTWKEKITHNRIPKVAFSTIKGVFDELETLRFLEVLRTPSQRESYVLCIHSRIVFATYAELARHRGELLKQRFLYDSLILEDASETMEVETMITLSLQTGNDRNRLKRFVLFGNKEARPSVNESIGDASNLRQSLFKRLVRIGYNTISLSDQT